MIFAYWSIVLTAFLPLVWVGAAKFGGTGYDNAKPRLFLAQLEDWPQRANWAQMNAYEAFPPFAAGVIIAGIVEVNPIIINSLAATFLIARILHGIFYITDKSTLRSLVWMIGFFSMVGLFIAAGFSG